MESREILMIWDQFNEQMRELDSSKNHESRVQVSLNDDKSYPRTNWNGALNSDYSVILES